MPYTFEDYNEIVSGEIDSPAGAGIEVPYKSQFSAGEEGYFKFTATLGNTYVIGVESGLTLADFTCDTLGIKVWAPSDSVEGAATYSSEADGGPEVSPYNYTLTGGARVKFTALEAGDYIVCIYNTS